MSLLLTLNILKTQFSTSFVIDYEQVNASQEYWTDPRKGMRFFIIPKISLISLSVHESNIILEICFL